MKRVVLILFLLVATVALSAPATISRVDIGSSPLFDSTFTRTNYPLITSVDGVKFANDEKTFVVLYDSTGGAATGTVAKPTATINIPGYGTVALSDLAVTLNSANKNIAIFQIPIRYNNSAGMATVTVDTANRLKVGVFRIGGGR